MSLLGWHSALSPNPDEPAALSGTCLSDPLMIWPLTSVVRQELESERLPRKKFRLYLAVDETFKVGETGGDGYWIAVPDPRADARFEDGSGRTFVNYLRDVFQWGGFPGWSRAGIRPEGEIAALKEGLYPF